MDIWHVRGGNRLFGSCRVQGSKNATLPILAASLVLPARSRLRNVPQLKDVAAAKEILTHLGCRLEDEADGVLLVDSTAPCGAEVPRALMGDVRERICPDKKIVK